MSNALGLVAAPLEEQANSGSPRLAHPSETFPTLQPWYVARSGILDTLDFHVQNGARVILLEGTEGFGKTVSLAQFAARHPSRSVAMFLRPHDTLLCHPDALRNDFYRQLYRLLHEEELTDVHADDALIRAALLNVHRKTRRTGEPVLFIIDGLHAIPSQSLTRSAITPHLHLETPNFAFVLSSMPGQTPLELPSRTVDHRVGLHVMNREDLRPILAPFGLTDDQLDQVRKATNGIPVKIGSIRRLLGRGATLEQVLDEVPRGDANFFESEWQELARTGAEPDFELLALVAVDLRSRTAEDLASLLNLTATEVTQRIDRFPFLITDAGSGAVRFESDAFRRFITGKLEAYTASAYERLVRELSSDRTSAVSLALLPDLLSRSNRDEELLASLSPEQFGRMIDVAESLSLIRSRAHMGLTSAQKLRRDPELLRFGLQESAVSAIELEPASRSAVEALLAVRDVEGALVLAQRSQSREDRLQLMSIVATALRESAGVADPALEAEIRRLSADIDPGLLGRKAVEIAADLIVFSPSLALELVERASRESGTHGDFDWALARLSLTWSASGHAQGSGDATAETLRSRIADPATRRFAARVAAAVAGSSAERVLAEVSRFSEPEERIYFLRNWLIGNSRRADAAVVAESLLGLVVETPTFSVTADFLRDVARGLPASGDSECVSRCVGILDSMKGTIAQRSRRLHLLELELALGEAESRTSSARAQDRFLETYYQAVGTGDLTERCETLALLLATLSRMGPAASEMETKHAIGELTRADLKECVDALLISIADHYRATRQIVAYLARGERSLAEEIAGRLNTRERREGALRDIGLSELAATPDERVDWTWIVSVIPRLNHSYQRDALTLEACDAVDRTLGAGMQTATLTQLWGFADSITEGTDRFLALCALLSWALKAEDPAILSFAGAKARELVPRLKDIDSVAARADAGYSAVSRLAKPAPDFARSLFALAEGLDRSSPLSGVVPSKAYEDMVRLAISAFGGLLEQRLDSEGALRALETLIQRLPSSASQVRLWSHIAVRFIRHQNSDEAVNICRRFVRPLLDSISMADGRARQAALEEALPVLFAANKTLVREQIEQLPRDNKNRCIGVLCDYLLRGVTVGEPYESVYGRATPADYDALVDVCNLLALSDRDAMIWSLSGDVAGAITTRGGRAPLTSQQRADIARRLRTISQAKLPHPDGIQHDGPAILCEAHIARFDGSGAETWSHLVDRARRIPNHADRSLVLGSLADYLPKNESIGRSKVIADAFAAAEAMPLCSDKVGRFVYLAETVAARDKEGAKRALKRACAVARELGSPREGSGSGRMLDVAYRIDESLAETLAKELDADAGRESARDRAAERLRLLEMKKHIGSGTLKLNPAEDATGARNYVRAAGMALGALNAGLKRPQGLNALREGAAVAASLPLDAGMPLYTWIVENVARSTNRTGEMRNAVTGIFQAAVTAADLTFQLVEASGERRTTLEDSGGGVKTGVVAGAGEREKVFEYLREWCERANPKLITICDQYFAPPDLDVVEMMSFAVPEAAFRVLTAKAQQEREGVVQPYRDSYRRNWGMLTDRDPPFLDVTIVGDVKTGASPIHDRWIIAEGAGLALGTSANSIGRLKLSQIREMHPDELRDVRRRLEPVILRSARVFEGHRVEFESFSI
jgi:hypothetical protein